MVVSLSRQRWIQILIFIGVLYLIFLIGLQVPFVFTTGFSSISQEPVITQHYDRLRRIEEGHLQVKAPSRPLKQWVSSQDSDSPTQSQLTPTAWSNSKSQLLSNISLDAKTFTPGSESGVLQLHKAAKTAFEVGTKLWEELESGNIQIDTKKKENLSESCPHSIILSGSEFLNNKNLMILPCGLTLGSHITIVGVPRAAHAEKNPKISVLNDGQETMVSQFMMELRGLKTVEGEEPPRILHFNPRLKGDFSGQPVIEQNTCYRMQWGTALRCQGRPSRPDEETVDGKLKCEKWIHDDENHPEQAKNKWWLLKRLGSDTEKVTTDWSSPFPFEERKLFVLTLRAGLEGYHVSVDGKHVTSFPYRTGFTLEDATGLTVSGDVDVRDIFAASLPTTHPSSGPQTHLEMSSRWQAPPLPEGPVELFIGILSAGNHFAERMAVRKSWMQHKFVQSSNVVARFFVALHARKEVNVELKKEAEFFGDIVLVPYLDNYDLVVLKTVAICEYGARTLSAKYIMKCDDDTFIRLDAVVNEVKNVPQGNSLYVGNVNYHHKPLRHGKWAVTYEEWPEEDYPPYANGPGYILSSDIAKSIVSEFESHKLRLFKMEDVSMGMWVEQFNSTKPVKYVHSLKFCQFGCIEGYYTAHYQSPRQMICLWNKLQTLGKAQCCNIR